MPLAKGEAADVIVDALVLLERVVDAHRGPTQDTVTAFILEDGTDQAHQVLIRIEEVLP